METISENNHNIEKQQQWDDVVNKLRDVTDGNGKHIEETIIETIAGLNVNNIPTNQSCGGHLEQDRLRFPYVYGRETRRPKYRYVDEEDMVKNFLVQHNLPDTEDTRIDLDQNKEFLALFDEVGETEEYQRWYADTQSLVIKTRKLIDEFNKDRSSQIMRFSPLYAHYKIVAHNEIEENDSDEEAVRASILKAQEEFRKFTEFLKNKFFANE